MPRTFPITLGVFSGKAAIKLPRITRSSGSVNCCGKKVESRDFSWLRTSIRSALDTSLGYVHSDVGILKKVI